jgi:hypothetical protein
MMAEIFADRIQCPSNGDTHPFFVPKPDYRKISGGLSARQSVAGKQKGPVVNTGPS